MSDGRLFKPLTEDFSVLVAGGGVSGLTAAHELAERGFTVYLIEKDFGLHKSGDERLQLGGMASTQYFFGKEKTEFPTAEEEKPPVLPGEHGFRFFPSYYSHVWNTMQRIPLYKKHKGKPRASNRTVYDNLEPCRTVATGTKGEIPYIMDRAKPTSAAEFVDRMRILFEAGYEPMDLDIYLTRLMRYMCTCSDRRAATCEDISFYDYLVGHEPGSKIDRYHYTKEFLDSIKAMPKVLAAFDAVWGDARTNWSTMIQLVANEVQDQPKVDAVLNGPTTEAWIEPWRKHLKILGVKFLHGKVDHFTLEDGSPRTVRAVFDGEITDRKGVPISEDLLDKLKKIDYTVVALDAPGAQEVTRHLPPIGVAGQLTDFVWEIAEEKPKWNTKGPRIKRDPYTESGKKPWDRFQTLTGIQYFFDRFIRVVHGHIYMPGTDWALSSLFEQDFWDKRPNLEQDKYLSLFSVDIGAWREPSHFNGRSANDSTKEQLAEEVWRQCHEALGPTNNIQIPRPHWYHMDTNIEYDPDGPEGLPIRNKTPYLIPIVGEFPHRPGAAPWNPAGRKAPLEPAKEDLWQAGHGGYLVHWDSMVFAGTYKKTFTRMTTMEAACESGRHAVNAILDHCNHDLYNDKRDNPGQHWKVPVGFRTERHLSPVYEPTPLADYCQIYDMEANELPNLAFAKEIDQWFFDHGLPHPWEVLGLDAFVSYISFVGSKFPLPKTGKDLPEMLGTLISSSIGSGLTSGGGAPNIETYLPNLLDAMSQLRKLLEKLTSVQPAEREQPND